MKKTVVVTSDLSKRFDEMNRREQRLESGMWKQSAVARQRESGESRPELSGAK